MQKTQNNKLPGEFVRINLRKLKKELKLIPSDIKREMRFLDLLFSEKNIVRTKVEKDVLKDMIEEAKKVVKIHQNRFERYQECYKQLKEKKSFDTGLLNPEEIQTLKKLPAAGKTKQPGAVKENRRTGTDG